MILRIKYSFLLLLFLGTTISAQNTKIVKKQKKHQQIQTVDSAYNYDFTVLAISVNKPCLKNTYTWYMNNAIHTTQGNYSGKLLDGICSKYYNKTNQLAAKGNYKNGQKTANWYEWNNNGTLLSNVKYKNGMKQGNATFYDSSGNIIEQCCFEKDKKHGKSISFVKGVKQSPVLYKHGEIHIKKEKGKKEKVSKDSKEKQNKEKQIKQKVQEKQQKQKVKAKKPLMKTDFLRSKNKKK